MSLPPRKLVRPEVLDLPGYKTGVSPHLLNALRAGRRVVRLASNENLYGPSPRALAALASARSVNAYPDGGSHELRSAVARRVGVDADRIYVSAGSEAVLRAVLSAVLRPGDRVVSLRPSFLLAEILSRAAGAEFVGVPHDDDLTFSADSVARELEAGARVFYLANPNNPTGTAFSGDELDELFASAPEEALIVVDEAYYEYAARESDYAPSLARLEAKKRPFVVLRTFSKAYGLAALRVGYGIFYDPELSRLVKGQSTVFDVNGVAQKAALAALGDADHVSRSVSDTLRERDRLTRETGEMGIRSFRSYSNFVTLHFDSRERALAIEEALARDAVFVKSLPGRGDEGLLRVTAGRPDDVDAFLESLRTVLG